MANNCSVLIAAAGRGTRAGLPYPKTLYPVQGKPILVRLLELVSHIDCCPTVIVSPAGRQAIEQCVSAQGLVTHLVEQPEPKGMGDAVLRFRQSRAYDPLGHVLLVWGDIPLIERTTLDRMKRAHEDSGNDFTFVTAKVENAYTVVERDASDRVVEVAETRELGLRDSGPGERDIGLFVFRCRPVLDMLEKDLPGKFGRATGEHGFLYVIGHLARQGLKVAALPIATENDLISLNRVSDLKAHA